MVVGGLEVGMSWAAIGQSPIHVIGINGGNFCSQTFKVRESFAGFRGFRPRYVLVLCVYPPVFAYFARKFDVTILV